MTPLTSEQVLSALTETVNGLLEGPEEKVEEAPSGDPIPLVIPPIPGMTIHAQALSKWITTALSKVEGATFTEDTVATMSRAAACITKPHLLREFILELTNVELVPGPVLKLHGLERHRKGEVDWPRPIIERELTKCFRVYYSDDVSVMEHVDDPASFDSWRVGLVKAMELGLSCNEFIHDLLACWRFFDDEHIWIYLCNHINIDLNEFAFKETIEKARVKALELKVEREKKQKELENPTISAAGQGAAVPVGSIARSAAVAAVGTDQTGV